MSPQCESFLHDLRMICEKHGIALAVTEPSHSKSEAPPLGNIVLWRLSKGNKHIYCNDVVDRIEG